MSERLDKIVSSQSGLSRNDVKKMARSGRIYVNGEPCKKSDIQIDPSVDRIAVDGVLLDYEKFIYLMLNKPMGVVSATTDKTDTTVLDLVPDEYRHRNLFPAGRLDKYTTGFVLITDDGEFAHNILSPSKHIEKEYIVTLERNVEPNEKLEIEKGMIIDGEELLPGKLEKLDDLVYSIVIKQGKYHQIKRMFDKFGNKVTALHRIRMGQLKLFENLESGECRKLTADEVRRIRE